MRKIIHNDNNNSTYLKVSEPGFSTRNLFRPSSFYDALGVELKSQYTLTTKCSRTVARPGTSHSQSEELSKALGNSVGGITEVEGLAFQS